MIGRTAKRLLILTALLTAWAGLSTAVFFGLPPVDGSAPEFGDYFFSALMGGLSTGLVVSGAGSLWFLSGEILKWFEEQN